MKTVGDIVNLVMSNKEIPELHNHAVGILEARKVGSTTKIGLEQVPRDVPVEEVYDRHVRQGCKCYKFTYDMGGILGAIQFKDAIAKYEKVYARNGRHGIELFVKDDSADLTGIQEDDIYVIVGNHNGVEAVFTWHPGKPLPSVDDGITAETAVKVDF